MKYVTYTGDAEKKAVSPINMIIYLLKKTQITEAPPEISETDKVTRNNYVCIN